MPKRLALQLASQFVVGIILAIVLGHAVTVRTYLGRLALVTLLGLLPFLMVNFPYWNWYAFPRNLTIVSLIDRLATIFCGGLVLAAMVKTAADAPAPPTCASAPAAATTGALAS